MPTACPPVKCYFNVPPFSSSRVRPLVSPQRLTQPRLCFISAVVSLAPSAWPNQHLRLARLNTARHFWRSFRRPAPKGRFFLTPMMVIARFPQPTHWDCGRNSIQRELSSLRGVLSSPGLLAESWSSCGRHGVGCKLSTEEFAESMSLSLIL